MKGDAFASFAGGGMVEAVVADGAQAGGRDMSQIARDELSSGDGVGACGVAFIARTPREGDGVFVGADDARIGDGGAVDVEGEVADDVGTVAEGADIDAPVALPDRVLGRRSAGKRAYAFSEDGAEARAQDRLGNEEAGALDGDDTSIVGNAGIGNDRVDMGMESEAAVPCVQDHGEAAVVRAEPSGVGEDVPEGA